MHTAELIRWAAIAGLSAALLRWPGPRSPLWAVDAGRPLVLARATVGPGRFRRAAPR